MKKVKYPRTKHLPWSPGATKDDLFLYSTAKFEGKEVVVTEKLDGENTTLYREGLHARSLEALGKHPSRSWIKSFHAAVASSIPEGWRICGENVYAEHSIRYNNLKSYFYIFSIWDKNNNCIDWADTCSWAETLGAATPNIFFQGIWNESQIQGLSIDSAICEGYVVRLAQSFSYEEFGACVAKYVRVGHVPQAVEHWMEKPMIRNELLQ